MIRLCKNCYHYDSEHLQTFGEPDNCPDAVTRFKLISYFTSMSNLEYLEYLYDKTH